mgnify:CR=1 FL=1
MIKSLAVLFFCIFIYGCFTGHLGAALISLGLVPFTLYGERKLDERDREWEALPCNAKSPPDTREILPGLGTECSADRV